MSTPTARAPDWISGEPDGPVRWRAAVDRVGTGLVGTESRSSIATPPPAQRPGDGPSISGVIDWANVCVGPIEVDVSRCRVNIALVAGLEGADRFLTELGDLGRG